MELKLKDIVSANRIATFSSYRQGFFYYNVGVSYDNGGTILSYTFPIPADDIGTATLLSEMKAITLMRWIRKSIEDGTIIEQIAY